jgi:adenylosuccinate synthase
MLMKVDVLLGLQWGDEGKGKIVDVLTPDYDIIARFQGGPNAGHTIEFDGLKFILHTIPSGIFNPKKTNVIGNGVIIDPVVFRKEVAQLESNNVRPQANLLISRKAHLILPGHRLLDAVFEKAKGKSSIGSTLKGIGPTYTDKAARHGIRVGDIFRDGFMEMYHLQKERHLGVVAAHGFGAADFLIDGKAFADYEKEWFGALESLKNFTLIDSEYYINHSLAEGKTVLAEGAQGTMLDLDFGSYPFVTSSNTITAGVCAGLGVAPSKIGRVYGVFKAYCTRVGNGPFPTELHDDTGKAMRDAGHEYGSTTGRPRRCGWLDLTALRYAIMLNGVTHLIMTKGDVLGEFVDIKVGNRYLVDEHEVDTVPFACDLLTPVYQKLKGWNCPVSHLRKYDELPEALKNYVEYIEKQTSTPVAIVSVGPDRAETIQR